MSHPVYVKAGGNNCSRRSNLNTKTNNEYVRRFIIIVHRHAICRIYIITLTRYSKLNTFCCTCVRYTRCSTAVLLRNVCMYGRVRSLEIRLRNYVQVHK